ncbi:hypothetical protein EDD11_009458 [Mortierella claussenii]|nr:hypothetical protein EDD11_009458 [Mortierella claussenii]
MTTYLSSLLTNLKELKSIFSASSMDQEQLLGGATKRRRQSAVFSYILSVPLPEFTATDEDKSSGIDIEGPSAT